MAEKTNERVKLTDEELRKISGAGDGSDFGEDVKDNKGRKVGTNWGGGEVYYHPCPNCGRPTHFDWFWWWCDSCNGKWGTIESQPWSGSLDELKAAGAAN